MARLRQEPSGQEVPLTSEVLVGRSRACALHLPHPWVSSQHAALRWSGSGWELRDLGSRNGTWLRGRVIEAGRPMPVLLNDPIGFGRPDETWVLVQDGPPAALARCGEATVLADDTLLVLPSSDNPAAIVFLDAEGRWVAEVDSNTQPVDDGHELVVEGRAWLLSLPTPLASTRDARALTLATSELVVRVSQDEEHIEAELRTPWGVEHLPYRAHHELLLSLARARADDDARGELPEAERGWLYQDDVARQLLIPLLHFNMAIHRARHQCRAAGFLDADHIIERRRGSGQIRLGVATVQVSRFA